MKLTSEKNIRQFNTSTFNLRLKRRGSPNRTMISFLVIAVLLLASFPPKAQVSVGPHTPNALENTLTSALTLQPDTDINGKPSSQNQYKTAAATEAKVEAAFGRMPLYFVENRGQLDHRVAYYVQGTDTSIYFTNQGMTLALTGPAASSRNEDASMRKGSLQAESLRRVAKGEGERQRWIVKVDFVGANPDVKPAGRDQTSAIISQFKGSKQQWKTGLKTYGSVVYPNLWPGIDLVYSGSVNQLKYSFVVRPGADANQIKLAYRGAKEVKLNNKGQLEVVTPVGSFVDEKPYSYQEEEGRQVEVATDYKLEYQSKAGVQVCGFKVGSYDKSKELVVDPVILVYAGYIGGAGDDFGLGIAVDSAGSAYVTGFTTSTEASFPVTVGPDLTFNGGGQDAFVAKVNAAGTALIYAGYIGGAGDDFGTGIAVDSAGNAYVTGQTSSSEASFPVTVGPDLTFNGFVDIFVAKVNATGTGLVYAGYIGGTAGESGKGIAVDSAGNAYVTGFTLSTEASFPVTVGPDLTLNGVGSFDAFVAKVNAAGTALVYAGYIGGADAEQGFGIAVDSAGNAYVTGFTLSTEASFPVTVGPDLTLNGFVNAFVAKVNAAGTALVYAGYIGGSDSDRGISIAVDSAGNAYVTGVTRSTEASFPVTVGPDLTFNGFVDAFIAKVNAAGTALVYAGYIGGADDDSGNGIAVDSAGNAYVTGTTKSTEASFPVRVGPDLTLNGLADAFVAKVNAAGTALIYAGYIGGSSDDQSIGIAVDSADNAYVTGLTSSTEASFPVTVGPDLTYNGGPTDAFIAKIVDTSAPPSSFDICLQDDNSGDFLQINSTTGDYQFTKCGPGGFTLNRTGTVRVRGSIVTLQQNGPDVRVSASVDNAAHKGTASIQVFSTGTTFTITDRNTTNNTCTCP
jgi:hypothetical protein